MKNFLAWSTMVVLAACQSAPLTPAVSPLSLVPQPLLMEVEEGQPAAILDGPVHFRNIETADFAWTEAWPQAQDGFPIVFRAAFFPKIFMAVWAQRGHTA